VDQSMDIPPENDHTNMLVSLSETEEWSLTCGDRLKVYGTWLG